MSSCPCFDNVAAKNDKALRSMLDELYTPQPVPVYPGKGCSDCACVGCDGTCRKAVKSIEFRLVELEAAYRELEQEQRRVTARLAELEARMARVEQILETQPAHLDYTTLVAEPLHSTFNLRDEILKMQIWRLQDGKGPIEARTLIAAIKHTDDALQSPVRDPNAGCNFEETMHGEFQPLGFDHIKDEVLADIAKAIKNVQAYRP